jgi:hypothetical protein
MTIDPGLCASSCNKKLILTSGRVERGCGDHPQFEAGKPSLMVKHNLGLVALHKLYVTICDWLRSTFLMSTHEPRTKEHPRQILIIIMG